MLEYLRLVCSRCACACECYKQHHPEKYQLIEQIQIIIMLIINKRSIGVRSQPQFSLFIPYLSVWTNTIHIQDIRSCQMSIPFQLCDWFFSICSFCFSSAHLEMSWIFFGNIISPPTIAN